MVTTTVQTFGQLDILVNNVGISTGAGPLEALSMAMWGRVMEVNLRAAVLMTRQASSSHPVYIHTPHAQRAQTLSEQLRTMCRKIAPLGIEGDA